ncbi:hypothetical protein BJF79_30420 [Actinomadura sp. CNU-125]|nr:hypothetical protein BJF79_30420 [Actinomadura sp. CNU-125]
MRVPEASRPKSGTRRSASWSEVSSRPAATSSIFSCARVLRPLNFTRCAIVWRCMRAVPVPMAARTSRPDTAFAWPPCPGHARITGERRRTVSSSPVSASWVNAQLSFEDAPHSSHQRNSAQPNSARDAGSHSSRTVRTPAYALSGLDIASIVRTCRTASSGSACVRSRRRSCGRTRGSAQSKGRLHGS